MDIRFNQSQTMSLKILHLEDTCTGCGACISSCPKHALTLSYDKEGFYYPHLDANKCISCRICEKSCHVLNAVVPSFPSLNYKAYMLKAKDKGIVRNSSSGGAFTLLANKVLSDSGIVYGARYNFDKEILERCSSDNCSLEELRKSKYIESYLGETFKAILKQLQSGRKVLFCGTPCQVEGLYHFLLTMKVDTTNLLLVRFICHGVPANRFFTEYKHYEERKYKSKMVSFDFRPKINGWRSSDWKMFFSNGKEVKGPYYHFYYYYCFQMSTLLRRSCYSCKRVYHELADITIGDFWGINKYRPGNKDQDGISLLLTHNKKGASMLSLIRDYCSLEELPLSAIEYVYREARDRKNKLSERKKLSAAIKKHGHLYIAKQRLRCVIMKRITMDIAQKTIKQIVKPFSGWILK